ncbi:hypothetical protein CHK_1348 [Christensenella hongkongensis]|uniref:Uncharacterized protein n=1 Tax=Christensenella hongkongensis TaxID=270498 RepID=A0A0M2NJ12_9FIRM|nr:hypothetical protein CHK_1348 [Christensenella hongkongensis]
MTRRKIGQYGALSSSFLFPLFLNIPFRPFSLRVYYSGANKEVQQLI